MEKATQSLEPLPAFAAFIEKRRWPVAIGLGFLALLLRGWHLAQTEANDPFFYSPIVDPEIYHEWAIRISRGEFDTESVFFLSPLYPYFLGAVYWLTGPGFIVPRVIQIVLGALTVVGIFHIGRRVFGATTGFVAGLAYALYAPAIFYEPLYLVTGIQAPLNVALVLALLVAFQTPERRFVWLGCGALLGLSALARPNVLLFGGFVILGLLLPARGFAGWRRALIRGFVFAVGVGLIVFPVTIRNYIVAKDIVLVTSTGGLNFYIGNNAQATGRFQTPPIFGRTEVNSPRAQLKIYTEYAEAETGRSLAPSEVADFWYRRAWSEIAVLPSRWIRLLGLKLSLFFNYYEIGNSRNFQQSTQYSKVLALPLIRFGLLGPFALLGMIAAARRWRESLLLYGMVGVYLYTVLMFFMLAHYRMPVTPFLAIFAAFGVVWTAGVCLGRRWLQAGLAAWALMGAFLWVNLPLTNPTVEIANIHYNLGNTYARNERYDDAIREFRESIKLYPEPISRYHNLAYVYGLRVHTYPEAIATWETVLQMGLETQDDYHIRAARQEIARLRSALGTAP